MKVLVTGANGLIGSAICARLVTEGHDIRGVVRHDAAPGLHRGESIVLDMSQAIRAGDWLAHLEGVDAVVNCAGSLQRSSRDDPRAVHDRAATALFEACEQAGVCKVIHFSAIGVERDQPSEFSATKLAGDDALAQRDLDWIILRPSVVLGRPVFGASAMFRGLAALPVLPTMPNTGRLQVVQLDDVVSTVSFFLRPGSPTRLAVDLAGPDALTMGEVIALYRLWLGWPPQRSFTLPDWAAGLLYRHGDFAGWLGWRSPMRTNVAREITRGATGDPDRWTTLTGIIPTSLASALTAAPATIQDRWFARLYFIKPAIFVVLPVFWITTGVISLSIGWNIGIDLLDNTAVSALSAPAVVAGAIADMAVGAMIAWRRTSRAGLWGAIAVSVFYAVAGTILRPDLWSEPLGPFLKILPILVLHFAALAILEER